MNKEEFAAESAGVASTVASAVEASAVEVEATCAGSGASAVATLKKDGEGADAAGSASKAAETPEAPAE